MWRKFSSIENGELLESLLTQAQDIAELSDGTKDKTDHLIVAIGHSARDTYHMMLDNGVAITPKPFAVGARIEHPQEIIDEIQFGSCDLLPQRI